MNAASTVLARIICGLVFGPVDRTVSRFVEFYTDELASIEAGT